MDRFLCLMLIGALLVCGMAGWRRADREPAQAVFFSLLFPQLVPGFEAAEEMETRERLPFFDEGWWKAVLL